MPSQPKAAPSIEASAPEVRSEARRHRPPEEPAGSRPWRREGAPVRYQAQVEYDGTEFAGFQVNPGKRTVQGVLEDALARLGDGVVRRVDGAGRTDAGVHATGQVIGFSYGGRLTAKSSVRRSRRSCLGTSRSGTSVRHRTGSTPATRRGTGSTATPSGTGRPARSASERRSGCGTRSTPPRWRGPGRPSSADTTSGPSGRGPEPGPDRHRGPGPTVGSERHDRRPGRLVPAGPGPPDGRPPPGGRSREDGDRRGPGGTRRPGRWAAGGAPAKGLCLRHVAIGATDRRERRRRTENTRNDEREDHVGP